MFYFLLIGKSILALAVPGLIRKALQIYAILAKEKLHYITFELHNMPNRLIAAGEWGTWMHKTFDGGYAHQGFSVCV